MRSWASRKTQAIVRFFGHGGHVAWWLIGVGLLVTALSSVLFAATASAKLRRDVTRMVFEDNQDVLEAVRWGVSSAEEQLERAKQDAEAASPDKPYLVVSIEERRLWYRQGDTVLFSAPVATGSGRILERSGGDEHWRFETPRGRLRVVSRELDPIWVPPDWHYVELAQERGLGVVRLRRGERLPLRQGGELAVSGSNVVQRLAGSATIMPAGDGSEIIVDGNIVIPPFGTNQRKYAGVLGTRRLNLGDGYAIHGTNRPETIGRSVSHGCIRMLNKDIEYLYERVEVGTAVYVY